MPSRRDAPRNPAARPAATAQPRGTRRARADVSGGNGARTRAPGVQVVPAGGVAFIEPRPVVIPRATDLGSVQVLKHANLFLLTDPFGDIHPDSRGLGLYHLDTRLISCCALRVGGARPVLLQGSMGANYRGSIQLTNPSADRNPDAKVHPEEAVAGRSIGISRDRLIGVDGMSERVRIVNHAERPLAFPVELELGSDFADIFEVRGYPRPARGSLLPIALNPSRTTFRYDGLDGLRRAVHVAFTEPAQAYGPVDARSEDEMAQGGSVRFRWDIQLAPGERRDLRWTIWPTTDATASAASAALFPEPPRINADDGATAYHAWSRGTTSIQTDHELFNLTLARSLADLRLLINDGPGPDQRYVSAGVPWFTTLFGRDALIASFHA